jgi:uncharacterized protein (DUF433 family)
VKRATPAIGQGIYTASDAHRILRIPYGKAAYWFRTYSKHKLKKATEYKYQFQLNDILAVNFLSLIEMKVFYTMKEHGLKTKTILEAHSVMSDILQTPYPFASKDLFLGGGKILFGDKHDLTTGDKTLQKVIAQFIIPFATKITFNKLGFADKFYPLENKTVVVNPMNQFGQPVIEGTNILTATIIDLYEGGESRSSIAKLYDITTKNVNDAIAFGKAA